MSEREKIVRLWFNMWLTQQDLGIDSIFAEDVVYTESWCPQYSDRETVKHWFEEWNTRGKVLAWDIKQFFHQGNQTVVVWYFKNQMDNGKIEEFDGISLIEWTQDNKMDVILITTIHIRMVMRLNLGMKKQTGFKSYNLK